MAAPVNVDPFVLPPRQRVGARDSAVWHCAIGPEGDIAVALSNDLKVYALRAGTAQRIEGIEAMIGAATHRTAGVVTWSQGAVYKWTWDELATRRPRARLPLEGVRGATLLGDTGDVVVIRGGAPTQIVRLTGDGLVVMAEAALTADPLWVQEAGERIAAVGYRDGMIDLWTSDPSRMAFAVRRGLAAHSGPVLRAVASNDGRLLATASSDLTIRVWAIEEAPALNGRHLALLSGHTGEITGFFFAEDNRLLVSCSRDRTIRVWDLEHEQASTTLSQHRDWVTHLAVNAAGTRFASCSEDGRIRVWDLKTRESIGTAYGTSRFLCLAISDEYVCAGDAAGNFWMLEYDSAEVAGSVQQARRYFVTGRVAGVGFRVFAQKTARELDLAGYVRNHPDGRIEVYGVGSDEQLARMKAALSAGPRGATITSVDEQVVAVEPVEDFSVR